MPWSTRAPAPREGPAFESRRRENNNLLEYPGDQDGDVWKFMGSYPIPEDGIFLPEISIKYSTTSPLFMKI